MNYNELLEILKSNEVYFNLKKYENYLFELIPEFKKCKGFDQNNDWHIYDVYEHILHVVEKTDSNICLRLAALFHDVGKPLTYSEDENSIGHFYNHWNESLNIFIKYQDNFKLTDNEIKLVKKLIYYHDINIDKMDDIEINKMIDDIERDNMPLLFNLKRADLLAQSPKYKYVLENINNQYKKVLTYK